MKINSFVKQIAVASLIAGVFSFAPGIYSIPVVHAERVVRINNAAATYDEKIKEGDDLLYLGEADEAIMLYTEAIKMEPKNVIAYNKRGLAYYSMNEYSDAADDFNKAVTLAPNDPISYLNRGYIYGLLNDNNQEIDDYNKAIQLDPNLSKSYFYRSQYYHYQKDKKEKSREMDDLNKAIELVENDEDSNKENNNDLYIYYTYRGEAYLNIKDTDKAKENFKKAIHLDPEHASGAYRNIGNLYLKEKNYNRAIENYTKAVQIDYSDGEAYFNRGKCYKKIGNKQRSKSDFNKANKLGYSGSGKSSFLSIINKITKITKEYDRAKNR